VNCFNFELSCASIIAIVSNTGGLEYPKSYVLCYVNGQHHHSASLTATLNHEGFLKLEVAMARLFRCKFVAPDNVAIEILVRGLAAATPPPHALLLRARLLQRPLRGGRSAAPADKQSMVSVWCGIGVPFGRCDSTAFTQASRVLEQPCKYQVNR
jgi:hypothetical protein